MASLPISHSTRPHHPLGPWAWVLIAASTLAGIAPIWLVPHDMWDGVAAAYAIESRDFSGLKAWLLDSNWWLLYAAYRAIAWLADTTGLYWLWFAKAVASAGVLGMALEVRLAARDVLKLDDTRAVFAGVLLPLLPFTYMLYDSVHLVVAFAYLALLGARWVHHPRRIFQLMGWLVIGASFQLNSNFAFVIGLELARWFCRDRQNRWNHWRSLGVISFAVILYLASRWLSAPTGLYAGYNNLLNPFAPGALFRQLGAVAMFATWVVFPLGISLGAFVLWFWFRTGLPQQPPMGQWVRANSPLLAALCVLLAAASLPYVALGKGPALFFPSWVAGDYAFSGVAAARGQAWLTLTVDHWIGRHAFLWVIPLSLLCAAMVSALPRTWRPALIALTGLQALLWSAAGHGAKIERAANEVRIVEALKQVPAPPAGSLVDILLEPDLPYLLSTLETNYLLLRSWSHAQYVGVTYFEGGPSRALTLRGREHVMRAVQGSHAFAAANVMGDFQATNCTWLYRIQLPDASAVEQLQWLFSPNTARVEPARVSSSGPGC